MFYQRGRCPADKNPFKSEVILDGKHNKQAKFKHLYLGWQGC